MNSFFKLWTSLFLITSFYINNLAENGGEKVSNLKFAENSFYRAYSLALKAVGSNKGTIARIEKNTH